MPAFAQAAGGMLTDAQIDVIAKGIRSWSRPRRPGRARSAPYSAGASGDSHRARRLSESSVHPATALEARARRREAPSQTTRSSRSSATRGLRTLTITGRPELGAPDWRGNVPGRPMSDREVTDVVSLARLATSPVPGPTLPERRVAMRSEPCPTVQPRGAGHDESTLTRRGMLMKIGILVNGVVAAAIGLPIVRYPAVLALRGRGGEYLCLGAARLGRAGSRRRDAPRDVPKSPR
jgi:hypothetical protein